MSDFQLAHPALAHLVWPWLAFAFVIALLERRRASSLDALVGASLRARLVEQPAAWRRTARMALLAVAGLAMIAALARPQWGVRHVAAPRVGAEIMIALDVSRSMLADDAKPSRLERAKAEIVDLLSYLEDDHVGLIAFAGRASVLSPMTPDKSFLRLVLDGVGPQSAGRGGTQLAEPIRRAIAGMGDAGPAQRALLLITDGEDHDSFALDAAKQAAAAGIKIIAIGFGDEAGSEISITDPKTGARTRLLDANGAPVVSRLNGDLLREIALATDGAYVPAGTGVLDLAAIYEAHIAKLTRGQLDERGKTIRDELYPWCVLLALLALVASVGVQTGAARSAALGITLLVGLGIASPEAARAQTSDEDAALAAATAEPAEEPEARADVPANAPVESPRERYNRAVALLDAGDFAAAAPLLRDARRDATDDPELRHAAAYDLGIAAAARAEAVEASAPKDALEALHEAADWFREASAQRPDDDDARHNLEVALRKALILADYLAKQSERGLESELDALVAAQREQVAGTALLLESASREDALAPPEILRTAYRDAATAQRTGLADAGALGERIARERDAIASRTDEERTPADDVRRAQLDAVLAHLDAAIERMGQARQQLRRAQAERAYRRSSAALAALARARDQLRGPVEQLDALLGELAPLAQKTAALAAHAERSASEPNAADLPAFLTPESLAEDATHVAERASELAARFELARSSEPAKSLPNEGDTTAADPNAELIAALAAAVPDVAEAARALDSVPAAIASERHGEALASEARAADELRKARERFLGLREQIEVAYAEQARIADTLGGEASPEEREALLAPLRELQQRNRARAARLEQEIARASEALAAEAESARAATPDPNAQPPARTPEELEAERARLARASELARDASNSMDAAAAALARTENAFEASRPATGAARESLSQLRALFFSIVEHVRETARVQQALADRTQDAAALAVAESAPPDPSATPASPPAARGEQTSARAAELEQEQRALAARAGEIGDALAAQSETAAAQPAADSDAQPGDGAADEAKRLRLAGERVVAAQLAMNEAARALADETSPLAPAQQEQAVALEELARALELLEPPQQPNEQQRPPQDQPSDDSQESSPDASDSEPSQPEPQPGDDERDAASDDRGQDPAQMLQGVRDREAERRRDLERRRGTARPAPVDKDW